MGQCCGIVDKTAAYNASTPYGCWPKNLCLSCSTSNQAPRKGNKTTQVFEPRATYMGDQDENPGSRLQLISVLVVAKEAEFGVALCTTYFCAHF